MPANVNGREFGMTEKTTGIRLIGGALIAFLILMLSVSGAMAQKVCKESFKNIAANTEYTQQHVIDSADIPGHQIRIYEIHRTFPDSKKNCEGLKEVESWSWGYSDYTNGNGRAWGYGVSIFENGDKWFFEWSGTSQALANPDGPGKRLFSGTGVITGGTGVYKGVRGTTRSQTYFDPETGYNEGEGTSEYWIEK
jgi:hypothetical protein